MDERKRQKIIEEFKKMFPEAKDGQFLYRDDRDCIEWICVHGVGHPIWDSQDDYVHGCCGCCKDMIKKFVKRKKK
jgi:hypothetical protein